MEALSISHGYNLLMVNRAWRRNGRVDRAGFGVVIAHLETAVRGRSLPQDRGLFNAGYHLSGPTAQAAIQRQFHPSERLAPLLEAKLTGSDATVPIEGGTAVVPNLALHGLAGIAYDPD